MTENLSPSPTSDVGERPGLPLSTSHEDVLLDRTGPKKSTIARDAAQTWAGSEEEDVSEAIPKESPTFVKGLHKIQASLEQLDRSVGDLTKSIQGFGTGRPTFNRRNSLPPPPPPPAHPPGFLVGNSKENEEGESTLYIPKPSLPNPSHVIPRVRDCSWEQFKNRFNKEETQYAIEVLRMGAPRFERQADEIARRKKSKDLRPSAGMPISLPPLPPPPPPPPLTPLPPLLPGQRPPPGPPPRQISFAPPKRYFREDTTGKESLIEPDYLVPTHRQVDPWIQRVRINSRSTMELLGSCSTEGSAWKGRPRTFIKPFHYLIRYHDEVKNKVEKLERRLDESENSTAGNFPRDMQDSPGPSDFLGELATKQSLDELRCYIEFMDKELLPIIHRFTHPNLSVPQTVHFHDLDYLFQIGGYVYTKQADMDLTPIQRIWRVCWAASSTSNCNCIDLECSHLFQDWGVSLYCLDHDGEHYGCLTEHIVCTPFAGEIDIRSLNFFPVQFLPNHGVEELKQARKDGGKFVEHISKGYSFYSGWSLTRGPDGIPILDPRSLEPMKTPEHIDSDVIVDLAEAFDFCPSWRPVLGLLSTLLPHQVNIAREKHDTLTIIHWNDETRTSREAVWTDIVVADQWIQQQAYDTLIMGGAPVAPKGGSFQISDNELTLLPRRMFGYAVWDRKFFPIDSRFLNSSSKNGVEDEAFDQLQILPEKKTIITALVQSHFSRKQLEQEGIEVPSQDLIRGKGRGIVILLHGLPGVGKTATAEAVAQKWKKPLFPITCGDLGFTPEKVEQSLKEIFRLAHLWDCILLLDEADVFIAQRAKHGTDLQRNALVSVFLRMLEYYNGVLFLTTNRVGVLDEAIKSRVHLHLKYDRLNRDQTLEIFKHNIQRLRQIEEKKSNEFSRLIIVDSDILDFARKQYDRNHSQGGMGIWNGRQIRNAFLIAAAIAHHEGDRDRETNPGLQKQLRSSHFEKVDKATLDYDRDRADVLQATDSDLAYDRQERFDGPIRRESAHHGSFIPQQRYQASQQPIATYSAPPDTFYGSSQASYLAPQVSQPAYAVTPQSYGGTRNAPGTDTPYMSNSAQIYPSGNLPTGGDRMSGLP